MVAFLSKSDVSAGFDQIVDFLNDHVTQYALMVNPTIYVSCIKRFWTTVLIKKANDAVKLQALVDGKRVVVTEDVIRQDLHLDDADGMECIPNEEFFTELAHMGYEKPPPKLIFYKAFFSTKWKFLIHTLVQCISAKRTAWNKFSCSMASAVICLATVDDLSSHTNQYTSPALTQKVFVNMRRVGKGFSGVKTPLFAIMLVQPQAEVEEDEVEEDASKQRGRIEAIDADEDITLVDAETQVDLGAELHGKKVDDNAAIKEMEHFKGMTYDKVRPIFEREYNKVQTLFKSDKDKEPTKKRVAEETLLQKSFKKLKAVKVSGSHSTQDTPTNDPKEMSEEDVKNMLEIVLITEFKVEALQVKYHLIDWEIHSEGSRSYWKIIRVDGIIQAYQSFEDMLKDFNREALDVL
nr:hypothetical protein [Tanacetum cinerariifolium]